MRLPLDWPRARPVATQKVKPPATARQSAKALPAKAGAKRRTMYTPALTMVEECRRAETGVGATMAPSSQLWKGSCAALVKPARAMSAKATKAMVPRLPAWTTSWMESVLAAP